MNRNGSIMGVSVSQDAYDALMSITPPEFQPPSTVEEVWANVTTLAAARQAAEGVARQAADSPVLSNIATAVVSAYTEVSKNGSNGGLSVYALPPRVVMYYYELVDENNRDLGRPYCKFGTPVSLGTGFYKMSDTEIALSNGGTFTEQKLVKELVEGGFFYE